MAAASPTALPSRGLSRGRRLGGPGPGTCGNPRVLPRGGLVWRRLLHPHLCGRRRQRPRRGQQAGSARHTDRWTGPLRRGRLGWVSGARLRKAPPLCLLTCTLPCLSDAGCSGCCVVLLCGLCVPGCFWFCSTGRPFASVSISTVDVEAAVSCFSACLVSLTGCQWCEFWLFQCWMFLYSYKYLQALSWDVSYTETV